MPYSHPGIYIILSIVLALACKSTTSEPDQVHKKDQSVLPTDSNNNKKGRTLYERISPPDNYKRIKVEDGSFADYLRHIPLKPYGHKAHYYNGDLKEGSSVYTAVLDLEIGDKDLHQCADAVMRLKAEYHWKRQEYDKIHFNLTNGHRIDYDKWMQGQRILVKGNKTSWKDVQQASNSYQDFWDYMELIFMYAGTASLEKELIPADIASMKIGDVFIKGGFPGHAMIVMDISVDKATGLKAFLLAQSYMPAQETQIVINPNDRDLSPWYTIEDKSDEIVTPEWTFTQGQLKRFRLG